ncbi:MAG TPA: DUF4337 domain-containing protein [Burkholderiales bacterium]|jgi:hypothetical protein|nr:DUF4337 domain-containing protein [Burkholderiales bacterium]
MSEDGFHVHGPHDHELEHAAHQDSEGFAGRLAVLTAVLSTVGALFSYQGGATQNDAMINKNNAAIKKTEASDQWNYYQAKSNKQNLAELAAELSPGNREKYLKEAARYAGEKDAIKKQADALEARSKQWDDEAETEIHLHHRWAQAMTVIQVSIALAAITLLTRRRWMLKGVYIAAGISFALAGMALLHL